jgi:hypothetical protein
MLFDLVYPFVMDYIVVGRAGTKGPAPIRYKGLKFCTHGSLPPRINSCLAIAGRLSIRKNRVKAEERIFGIKEFEARKLFRLKGACVRLSGHRR